MGKVPKLGLPMRTLMRTHRYVGRLGLVLAAAVAFFCWIVSPAPNEDGAVHGAFASSGFIAISLKLALLKWRPALAYRPPPGSGSTPRSPSCSSPSSQPSDDLGFGSDGLFDNSGSDSSGSDNSGSDDDDPRRRLSRGQDAAVRGRQAPMESR